MTSIQVDCVPLIDVIGVKGAECGWLEIWTPELIT
eukprot:SAG22_NODE_12766_length_430_cov_0.839879_1_plen_34_part_10